MSAESSKATFTVFDYVVFSTSLIVSLGIGVYQGIRGRGKDANEYLMAKMSPVPVILSLIVGVISAISILGNSSEMYFYGTQLWTNTIGVMVGAVFMCYFIVPVIYPLKLISIYEYLGLRWKMDCIGQMATIVQIFNMILFLGIALYAPSLALSSVTPIPTSTSIAVLGVVCTIYSSIGGVKAVVYTDTFQSVVMVAGVVAVIAQGCVEVGGGAAVWEINKDHGRIEFFNMNPDPLVRHTFWTTTIFGFFFTLQMYAASQSQYQRWGAVATFKQSIIVLLGAVIGLVIGWSLVNFSGLAVFAVYADCDPFTLGLIDKPDQITAYFVADKLGYLLGVPGLFVAAVYSAVLSSVSTILNAMAAIIWNDLLKPLPSLRDVPSSTALLITKSISVIGGVVAIGLGFMATSMGGLVQAAYSIGGAFGGPITGLFVAAIFCPWVTGYGALVGALMGLAVNLWVVIGSFLYAPPLTKLSLSTDGCDSSVNITNAFGNVMSSFLDERETENNGDDEVFPLYLLSYCYVLPLGCLATVVFASFASLVLGFLESEDIPEHLVDKSCLRFYKWLCSFKADTKENDFALDAEKKMENQGVSVVSAKYYTGELPLRHLIQELDGPTKSHNKWSGTLGNMLDEATHLEINKMFPKVDVGPPIPVLPEEVVKDLSTDQSYAYPGENTKKLVRDIVLPVIKRTVWYARSETVLQAMLSSHCAKLHAEAIES
ncbi:sodium-coupled monocarboxylate transporter 1-like [Oratosquilla oratoria]|uniref:sodium-coupled monocarboxylate transporter 1-like n=1 Tax=Oratosquilla oratoria TaxID=337810 RepID=UPI003F770B47